MRSRYLLLHESTNPVAPLASAFLSLLFFLALPLMPASGATVTSLPPPNQVDITAPPPTEDQVLQGSRITPKPPAIPKFDPPSGKLTLSALPTDRELIISRFLEIPLAPETGAPQASENADLARALNTFGGSLRDVSPLVAFLSTHPETRWRASLQANIGLIYRHEGYWSKAIPAWEDAWALSKGSTDPLMKAISDRVLGELAMMHGRLGHIDRLESLKVETQGRDIRGSGTEYFREAMDGLWLMKNKPGESFRCGPLALGGVYQTLNPGHVVPDPIRALKSTTNGTDLATLASLAQKVGLDFQVAFREPGAVVLTPSVVHWKVGHFAALTEESQGQYLSRDPTFGINNMISTEVLDGESSGYFLVKSGPLPTGWRQVAEQEAKKIYGKGTTSAPGPPPPPCQGSTPSCGGCPGMTRYTFEMASISLMLMDTPVGYTPPVGPAVQFTANYNHREAADSTNISNLGNMWCFSWLAYIQAPSTAATVSYGPDGGQLPYTGYNSATGAFSPQQLSQDVLIMDSSTKYELDHGDGSKDIYALAEPGSNPLIFRTQTIDRFGNAITYNYDSYYRIQTVTDAIGQTSVISYGLTTNPTNPLFYSITQVTDPFGRSATFQYNSSGQLASITDVLGITSSFSYGTGNFISSLTTPYGTTGFTVGGASSNGQEIDRWLQATDPMGGTEHVEWQDENIAIPNGDPASTVPSGFENNYMEFRNTFYWDKKAMPNYPDITKARRTHWCHDQAGDNGNMSYLAESTLQPLENRVWRAYPGQIATYAAGTSNKPTKISRILDDGTEQDYIYQYNGMGNVTQAIDPVGREHDFVYATNQIDLLQAEVKNGSGYDVNASSTYNSQHLPLTATDASGQATTYTYNAAGQVLTVTDPLGETTTYSYNSYGYLQSVTGPVTGATTTFTYDGFGRVQTVTDSEGYTVTAAYDTADRPVELSYPDGTNQQILYNLLDKEWTSDRLGRWTRRIYDALQHVVVIQDPLLRRTSFDWCTCGLLVGLIDSAGNRTSWASDIQSRIIQKIFPDGTAINYTYEATTSRLKSVTDATAQITNYNYFKDNAPSRLSYFNESVPTPSVNYTYDPVYPRISTMVDGIGTRTYAYNPITSTPTLGAGRLYSVTGPLANAVLSFTYDALGRLLTKSINGSSNTSTLAYDAIGRLTSNTNPLGQFAYSYVDTTNRLASVNYPNGQKTNYSYYPNSAATPGNDDQRLQQIQNLNQGGSNLSTFAYTYDAFGNVQSWTKQYDAGSSAGFNYAYDAANQLVAATAQASSTTGNDYYGYDMVGNRIQSQLDNSVSASSFNNLNEMAAQGAGNSMTFSGTVSKPVTLTIGGQPATVDAFGNWRGSATVSIGANSIPLVATDANNNQVTNTINVTASAGLNRTPTYDANGNLTNNGVGQTYQWDSANRLVMISQSSGMTGFVYDGAGRRTQETLNGTVIKQWVWNGGTQPVEERDGSNNVTKRFFGGLGEQIGGVSYYFTSDHLGSVREMTDGTGTTRARYDYDPYGRMTKISGDLTADFGFTGDYYHAASGLSLTMYRAYDPNLGRWLSRDPLGESKGINLYDYVLDDPLNFVDRHGLDSTSWGGDGRSVWDGPKNGNWGGKNWSGGQNPNQHGGVDGLGAPTDSGDENYMGHDLCYERCDHKKCPADKEACKKICNRVLVLGLQHLSNDPRSWPHPPRPGTEDDSASYRNDAIYYFSNLNN